MNAKEKIIQETIRMIEENKGELERITIREISKRTDISVGLINYHFKNKDRLIEISVQRIISKIVENYAPKVQIPDGLSEEEAFLYVLIEIADEVFEYLFSNPYISKVSILGDYRNYQDGTNSDSCVKAFSVILARKTSKEQALRTSFYIISCMQVAFLRALSMPVFLSYDFRRKEDRRKYLEDLISSVWKGMKQDAI